MNPRLTQVILTAAVPNKRLLKMRNPKSKAEEQLAALRKKDKQVLLDKEKGRQQTRKKVARLKALRLAQEDPVSDTDGAQ